MLQSEDKQRLAMTGPVSVLGLIAAILTLTVTGCNNSASLVPVSGVVTFDGGPPPDSGTVVFKPESVAEGFANRSGRATFSTDGKFVVTSFQKGDGLAPGKYTAEVSCYHSAPKIGTKDPFGDASNIDKSYEPASLVVEPGSNDLVVKFDVPLKK